MTPLVFLDFDGVIMTRASYIAAREAGSILEGDDWTRDVAVARMDPVLVGRVSALCSRIGADVVLSTSWRHCLGDNAPICEALRIRGLIAEVVGATPSLPSRYRGDEIVAWLDEHRPGWQPFDVVLLDDDGDLEPLLERWVRSTFEDGFGDEQLVEALALFPASAGGAR